MSNKDLAGAREATRLLLDRVGLATYLFEVKPTRAGWTVRIEHPRDGAWHRTTIQAADRELLETLDDPRRRRAVADQWRERLIPRVAAA